MSFKTGLRIVLITAGLLGAVVLVDFTRTYFGLQTPSGETIENVHTGDPVLGWKPRPRAAGRHHREGNYDVTYTMDELGRRAIQNSSAPRRRLYFFGDSYTFGHGVNNEHTFTNVLRERHLAHDVAVYNLGVNGYGFPQMMARFLEIEPELRKGDVVVFTPTSDDITRNVHDFVFPYQFLLRKSEDVPEVGMYPVFENGTVVPIRIENTLWNKLKVIALVAPWTGGIFRAVHEIGKVDTTAEAIAIVRAVRERTAAKGAEFALIFLPRLKECAKGEYREDLSGFDFEDIRAFFPKDEAALDALRFPDDSHWNEMGHAVAAEAIAKTLRSKRILWAEDYLVDPGISEGR